jgi:hypothetical protein
VIRRRVPAEHQAATIEVSARTTGRGRKFLGSLATEGTWVPTIKRWPVKLELRDAAVVACARSEHTRKASVHMTTLDQGKRGLQDDHDPHDIGQKLANKRQGVSPEQSQKEGPAAYAPKEDEPTAGDDVQKQRHKIQRQENAKGDRR